MSASTIKHPQSGIQKQETTQRIAAAPVETTEALDQSDIAELSPVQISRMTCDELIRIIRASRLPILRPEINEHLEFYDRPTLERLVYLARRCCRNQEL